jgi:hypothetical protein
VRAGLTPRLKNGAIAGSAEWLYTPPLTPSDAEQRPFHALAQRIGAILGDTDEEALASELCADPASIARLASDALSRKNAPALILVVDQLEELFAEQALADQREPFLALLAAGAGHGGPSKKLDSPPAAIFISHSLNRRLKEKVAPFSPS